MEDSTADEVVRLLPSLPPWAAGQEAAEREPGEGKVLPIGAGGVRLLECELGDCWRSLVALVLGVVDLTPKGKGWLRKRLLRWLASALGDICCCTRSACVDVDVAVTLTLSCSWMATRSGCWWTTATADDVSILDKGEPDGLQASANNKKSGNLNMCW